MDNISNLQGLFNLSQQIRIHGPLRMYWDGGYKCETVLRSIKSLINHGTHVKNLPSMLCIDITNIYIYLIF